MSVNTLQNPDGSFGDLKSATPHKKGGHHASFNSLDANGAIPNSKHAVAAPSNENSLSVPNRSRAASNSSSVNSVSPTALSALPVKNGSANPEKVFETYAEGKVKNLFDALRNETVRISLDADSQTLG
jgi:hypothetical protein